MSMLRSTIRNANYDCSKRCEYVLEQSHTKKCRDLKKVSLITETTLAFLLINQSTHSTCVTMLYLLHYSITYPVETELIHDV